MSSPIELLFAFLAFGGKILALIVAALFFVVAIAAATPIIGTARRDALRDRLKTAGKALWYYYPGGWGAAVVAEKRMTDLRVTAQVVVTLFICLVATVIAGCLVFIPWLPLTERTSPAWALCQWVWWLLSEHTVWSIAGLLVLASLVCVLVSIQAVRQWVSSAADTFWQWLLRRGKHNGGDALYDGREKALKWWYRFQNWLVLFVLAVLGLLVWWLGVGNFLANNWQIAGGSLLFVVAVLLGLTLSPVLKKFPDTRTWLRKWTGEVPKDAFLELLWGGKSRADAFLIWWRTAPATPPTTPAARPEHQALALKRRVWGLVLVVHLAVLLVPWVPVTLDDSGSAAGASSTSSATSGAGTAATPTNAAPAPKANPGPSTITTPTPLVVDPPKPPRTKLGARLARELVTKLEDVRKGDRKNWGIEMKVPAAYDDDDQTEAIKIINDPDLSAKAGIHAGYVADYSTRLKGYIRVTPPGELPVGKQVVDIEK
jgi:hypothetical protein